MAQKRNPVSLRLQTRLKGYEKRFASCWFTDSFFSQVYTTDLVRRLYLGHLLQKGGSWYGEVSESRVPETCISIQFLYRRCLILSIVLDRRKEEYVLSSSLKGVQPRRGEEIGLSSRTEIGASRIGNREETNGEGFAFTYNQGSSSLNNQSAFSSPTQTTHKEMYLRNRNNLVDSYGGVYTSLFSERSKKDVFTDQIVYLSIANSFGSIIATHKPHSSVILSNNNTAAQPQWQELLHKKRSCHYHISPDLPTFSTIESVCDLSKANTGESKRFIREINTHKNHAVPKAGVGKQSPIQTIFGLAGDTGNHFLKDPFDAPFLLKNPGVNLDKGIVHQNFVSPFTLSSHWTSLSLMRGVSACQSVEFCLYSVLFLCQKRFSFLKIKDILFKMLASNDTVRGVRLVYSGRQGGRSKSAMRAKKQSALWGETALSLFSSRLAFASTGVDTSFGQIGIKLWICYK